MGQPKKIRPSKYKGVCFVETKDNMPWMMRFNHNGMACIKRYTNERDAAMAYDLKMLELGLSPVNIYKPKI